MNDERKGPKPRHQQRDDVDFLHETFDIPTPDAAGLVTKDERKADRLSREANARELGKDEFEGRPAPEAPENELTQDADEDKLKPLIRNRKK